MSQQRPVPRLDLAPNLKRPLSLRNPLDYLRLLYWVFFFPQALRWYVDTFGGEYIPEGEMNWRKRLELLRQNRIQRQLLLQGLVLVVVTSLALSGLLAVRVSVDWLDVVLGVVFGVAGGWAFGLAQGIAEVVALGVAGGVAFGLALGVAGGVMPVVVLGLALGVAGGVAGGVAEVVALGVARVVALGVAGGVMPVVVLGLVLGVAVGLVALGLERVVALGVALGVAGVVALGLALGGVAGVVALGVALGVAGVVALGLALSEVARVVALSEVALGGVALGEVALGGVALGLAILRPENWLIGLSLNLRSLQNGSWLLPRITPLPLPYLAFRLQNWLQQDWETGLHNTNQLLKYTLQFIPVVQAVNRVLATTPSEQIIWRVSRLAEAPFDWKLVRFASASLSQQIKSQLVEGFLFLRYFKELFSHSLRVETRLDTPARAAAAGFWHLHEQQPAKAMEAFAVVRSLLYGEEMFTLAQTLAAFHAIKEPASIAALQVPAFPTEPLLRPVTWKFLASLRRVFEEIQVAQRSVSRTARAIALTRTAGEIKYIVDNGKTLPQAEQYLIADITRTLGKAFLQIAGEIGEISITEPVRNPYVVGDPVLGKHFVGREDVLRQLEELWKGHQLQSVVIYGHRRMGKSSILRNAANSLRADVKVAYINLLEVGDAPQGVVEVLMAICDAIAEQMQIPPPTNEDLLNLPLPSFRRYLKQVETQLGAKGLMIALDEFEKIEELIEAEKIPKDFMGFLRGLVQMSSKIAFAFAGLHTLEEMTADYFHPFFGSVIHIPVGFIERAATRQILANPGEDFLLDYMPEALDRIYTLTDGQPYLVQLVGFQLVRRYNDAVFEQGRSRDPVFTLEDVEAVIDTPKFFKQGRYYFEGIWGQAARGAAGQQAILQVLAPQPEGLSIEALAQTTAIDELTVQEALKTLKRHDVVKEAEGRWRIIVELFRRWVLQQ